jgi:hypothetical protein
VRFDLSRPVPWNLLIRRFGVMFVGALVIVGITTRQNVVGLLGGLVAGGALFFAMSWLLSKFGFAPKSMAQIRAEGQARAAERAASPRASRRSKRSGGAEPVAAAAARPQPAPTRRTASGVGRHPKPRRR